MEEYKIDVEAEKGEKSDQDEREILDLVNADLNTKEWAKLGEIAQNISKIKEIKLCKNRNINGEGLKSLCSYLASNQQLITLDLNNCRVENKGIGYIAQALSTNHTLKKLNIRKNEVTAIGMEMLCNALSMASASLFHLVLSANKLKDEGLIMVSKLIASGYPFQVLELGENRVTNKGTKIFCEALRKNIHLKKLRFGKLTWIIECNNCGVEGSKYFADLLSQNAHIQELYLGSNLVSNTGMKYLCDGLKSNSALNKLSLSNVFQGMAGTDYLVVNNIEEDGVKCFNESSKVNTSLRYIDLRYNFGIGNQGKELLENIKSSKHDLEIIY